MARGLAVAVVVFLVAAAPAGATEVSVTCVTLQSVLTNAADGDVITLNSSASPGGLCNAQYTLHDFGAFVSGTPKSWTLKGRAGMNDGFDGTGLAGRMLTGTNVHRLLIQDLTFRDGVQLGAGADGGALSITGDSSLQVFLSEFYANIAADRGGAISVAANFVADAGMNGVALTGDTFGSATEGNGAGTGGAVSVVSAGGGNKSFNDNVFSH